MGMSGVGIGGKIMIVLIIKLQALESAIPEACLPAARVVAINIIIPLALIHPLHRVIIPFHSQLPLTFLRRLLLLGLWVVRILSRLHSRTSFIKPIILKIENDVLYTSVGVS